ncbi:two-component sensor histidine kinase [Bacteroidia bacterium]|nr:two-component sensor histidine kinase [Bacteroidia bacterium]
MKTTYKQKLFLYFVVIFALFTIGIFLFEQSREREHKTEALEEKLDAYANLINEELRVENGELFVDFNSQFSTLNSQLRLTLIDRQGNVLYDNEIKETSQMENHAQRPEIKTAREKGKGRDIRISSSNEKEYLYYAKRFNDYYIRVALPYDIQVRHFLKSDNFFLYFIVAFFMVMLFLINYVSNRFGKSIKQLRDFTYLIENGEWRMENENNSPFSILNSQFPKDELGEIGEKIAENYIRLKESQKEIALEREKLLQHVHSSEEALCFFAVDKSVEFYNGLFIKYLNTITDEAESNLQNIFTDISFEKITSFITNREKTDTYFETQISKQGRNFVVRVNIFDDNSFEIIINDITKQEKMRQMKQEMTGNITHELRTPVTGIRGCLETILEHPLSPEKKQYFIESAYSQVLVLSELIQDMSLITKIEEAPQSFKLEAVDMENLLENLKNDLEIFLQEKNIQMEWNLTGNVVVNGNRNLLYSIFRNLTDNAIRYAGTNVTISIKKYNEDKDFYYFSYSDTGIGIPEEHHLNRLFERFYRINEGRTRDTGGSGLGLSIVKNAIAFHKGTIVAKNKTGGGLEFLFTLKK